MASWSSRPSALCLVKSKSFRKGLFASRDYRRGKLLSKFDDLKEKSRTSGLIRAEIGVICPVYVIRTDKEREQ
jgi:hypothetical protein